MFWSHSAEIQLLFFWNPPSQCKINRPWNTWCCDLEADVNMNGLTWKWWGLGIKLTHLHIHTVGKSPVVLYAFDSSDCVALSLDKVSLVCLKWKSVLLSWFVNHATCRLVMFSISHVLQTTPLSYGCNAKLTIELLSTFWWLFIVTVWIS